MRRLAIGVLFASIAIFYASTLRLGNRWGDDFALYILHAQNIVSGRPYAATGYIYNPQRPEYGPRVYPPVFPLLLAPICKVLGLNFTAMKLEQSAFLLLALALMYFYWRRDLPFPYLMALIASVAFNPSFWEAKDDILSDLPFLAFFYLAAVLVRLAPRDPWNSWRWAVLTGVTFYLCAGTRGIGVTLLPGLFLYEVLKYRRLSAFACIAAATASILLFVQRLMIGPGLGSYADQFHPTILELAHNLLSYARTLGTFWLVPHHRPLSILLYAMLCLLAVAGLAVHLKRGITPLETFLIPYVALVLLWPAEKGMLRFLFPLMPFFVYLILLGIQHLAAGLQRNYSHAPAFALLLLLGGTYLATYRHANFGPIAETDGSPSFLALCRIVHTQTAPGDVFLYQRARALALFTARPASTYAVGSDDALWLQAQRIHASYLITSAEFPNDRQFLAPFAARHQPDLDLIYQNRDFSLYRIRSAPAPILRARNH